MNPLLNRFYSHSLLKQYWRLDSKNSLLYRYDKFANYLAVVKSHDLDNFQR